MKIKLKKPVKTYRGLYCMDKKELNEKLLALCNDLARRITGIGHRPDVHLVSLLSWTCPLHFCMEGRSDHRGWMENLVLGDSRTGKSETASKLQRLVGAGETISSENCTFVGLIGGLQKGVGERQSLVWGRLPRNNGGHLTIEELSGMSVEDIGRTTDVRSSGIARIDKGGIAHSAFAKTRQLYLSNPRKGASLSRNSNGVKVIQQLIGANEDIARFDIILLLGADEVGVDMINTFLEGDPTLSKPLVPDVAWTKLLSFIWSLDPEDVYLTKEAEQAARTLSATLSREFHQEIPIFNPADGRYKLARIACAVACLTLHLDVKERIRVEAFHIEYAADLLRQIWTKPIFGYDRFSQGYKKGEGTSEPVIYSTLRAHLTDGDVFIGFCDMMADRESFSVEDLMECSAQDKHTATALLHSLNNIKVISKIPDPHANVPNPRSRWSALPVFRVFLQKYSRTSVPPPTAQPKNPLKLNLQRK